MRERGRGMGEEIRQIEKRQDHRVENGAQRSKINERNKGRRGNRRLIVEVEEGNKEVEAENLGGNNSVPLLAARLQRREQRTTLVFLSSLCHVPFFSQHSVLSFLMCQAFLWFFHCTWLLSHTYFNTQPSFCIPFFFLTPNFAMVSLALTGSPSPSKRLMCLHPAVHSYSSHTLVLV